MTERSGTEEKQLDFVLGEVDTRLRGIKRHLQGDRRKAFGLEMATVSLSACSTVLLGVRVGDPTRQVLLDVALGISALITVLAAWQAFFSHRSLWIQASRTVALLETLKREIEFTRAGGTGDAGTFLTRLEVILKDHQEAWTKLRQRGDAAPEG
ncbi:SLATT domain-containing protein [Streptacidiphilus jiangxiensis]|uniref:SMODS and SLOG-associating 2TM effector domain-containing protein n=1 Tax=Streptacidiphilus jiangxiensis TaxID=235985 RepID=A0A1H7WRI2_STRJI|nr:SLATT domain-containing protein [Streptacidiphilus jiangxiensis]SEM24126.1 hypothetical protein SAMN05414137_12185 [Streptacidiphilus jiangxiensis]